MSATPGMLLRRFLIAAVVMAAAALPARAADVLVFAAASTTDAVTAAIAAFEAPPGVRVRASFASSSTLARQIAEGAPANIYISANEKWMDWVAAKGKIVAESRRDLLRNSLVLIAPKSSADTLQIAQGFDLAGALGNRRLAIGDPDHVPAGIYAKEALTRLGVWNAVATHTARAADVRAALALVERGEAPLGIVYSTDAKASSQVRVVDTFPAGSHPPIVYPAALVSGRDTKEARSFFAFLEFATGRAIFSRYGFSVD